METCPKCHLGYISQRVYDEDLWSEEYGRYLGRTFYDFCSNVLCNWSRKTNHFIRKLTPD